MLRRTEELDEFERRYARDVLGRLTYAEALSHMAALWAEAKHLDPDFPAAWLHDLDADLELARVLNGLPADP
jgi:hypothetical protein